jgi:hypothetical protein
MASLLRFVPKSSADVPIDWNKVPEKSKQYFRDFWVDTRRITDEDAASEERSLPQTIGGLTEYFHKKKFFSYMKPELCQLLLDIGEFGLKCEESQELGLQVGPRFYMKFGSEMWFLLFAPGDKEGVALGFSAGKSPDPGDEVDFEEEAEKDREVAEIFDKKLVDEVSRFGILGIIARERLAGWEAFTMKSQLEEAQLARAMFSLPPDHPYFVEFARSLFTSFKLSCR